MATSSAQKTVARKVVARKTVGIKSAPAKKAPSEPVVASAKPAEAPAKPAKVVKPAKPVKEAKAVKPKVKLVRDSFTMPSDDWALIAVLKDRALGFKRPTKKSELLRAGLQALAAMPDAALQSALTTLQPLKPGRPKAEKK